MRACSELTKADLKKFREDLGEVSQSMKSSDPGEANDNSQIVDSKKLNDLISEAIKKKRS